VPNVHFNVREERSAPTIGILICNDVVELSDVLERMSGNNAIVTEKKENE
jgi:hypothetical protein